MLPPIHIMKRAQFVYAKEHDTKEKRFIVLAYKHSETKNHINCAIIRAMRGRNLWNKQKMTFMAQFQCLSI